MIIIFLIEDGKMIKLKDIELNIIKMEHTKKNIKFVIEKHMEYFIMMIEKDMKEYLKMIKEKDMEQNIIIMEINMKENLKMIKEKDMEYIISM